MKPIKAYTNLEELRPVIMPHTLEDKLTQAYDDTSGADWNRAAVFLTHSEIDIILQALKVCPKEVKNRTRLTGKYYVNNWEFSNLRITQEEKDELIKREIVAELATKLHEFVEMEHLNKNDDLFITEYKLDLNIEINK